MKRKRIPENLRRQQIPADVLKLLQAMGRGFTAIKKQHRNAPHQGPRECARRVRQMQRSTSTR